MTEKYVFDERTLCIRVDEATGDHDYVLYVATPDGKYAGMLFFDGPRKLMWPWRGTSLEQLYQFAYEAVLKQMRDKIKKDNDLLELKEHETTVFPKTAFKSIDAARVVEDMVKS